MKKVFNQFLEKITHSTFLGRALVVLIILAVLGIAMILSGPKPPGDFDPFAATPTPVALDVTGMVAPTIPSTEYKLTNGVVLAVVSVVLVVLIGTVIHILRFNKQNRE